MILKVVKGCWMGLLIVAVGVGAGVTFLVFVPWSVFVAVARGIVALDTRLCTVNAYREFVYNVTQSEDRVSLWLTLAMLGILTLLFCVFLGLFLSAHVRFV